MKRKIALDLYTPRVYRILMILAPLVAFTACLTFTLGSVCFGWFGDVAPVKLIFFDLIGICYFAFGLFLRRKAFDRKGELRPGMLRVTKTFLATLSVLHWNLITYLFPSNDHWAFIPLFILMSACFLDSKLVLIESGALLASALTAHFVLGDAFGPGRGADYASDLFLRAECLVLSAFSIYILTRLVNVLLMRDLEFLSDFDSLTRVRNRRSLDDHLSAIALPGAEYTAAMLDIDDFKAVNDTYGHGFGDVVLRRAAEIISCDVKKDDLVFRYGGEEFLILFRCGTVQAGEACLRILNDVRSECFHPMPDVTLNVTVTVGLSPVAKGSDPHDAVNAADANMYAGKRSGKSCVVCPAAGGEPVFLR